MEPEIILQQASQEDLLAAIDRNYRDCMRAFGLAPMCEIRDDDTLFWFYTGIPDSAYNSIMYANLTPAQIPDAIKELQALRARFGVPMNWLVGPASRPTDLGARLMEIGLKHFVDLHLMSMDLNTLFQENALPEGVQIELVRTLQVFVEWTEIEGRGFEMDARPGAALARVRRGMGVGHGVPLYHFLARLENEPVATASILFGAGIVGVYDVSVIPSARRRGIGGALTRHVLGFARQRGYQYACLQASPMGFRLYEEIGFRHCGACSVYG